MKSPRMMRRLFQAGRMLGLVLVFVLVGSSTVLAVTCETDALSLLQQNDGPVGLYLKRVNGPVMAGFNEFGIFEPASTIKVLIYTHALRQVQDGAVTLATGIDWTRDLNEDKCGSHPCNVGNPQAENDPLMTLLQQMMQCSDNRHTNALRIFFGDAAILATGAALGMTDTDFNHIIGCPTCATYNEITLVDLGRDYEGVANGYLDQTHQDFFHDFMRNETNFPDLTPMLNTIIDDEVAKHGKDAQVATDFKALVRYATKGGSYTTNGCVGSEFRSLAGIVEFPINNGLSSCQYVFGAWMNELPAVVQGAGTVSAELLRLAVCEALKTWDLIEIDMLSNEFAPPQPWAQEGVLVDTISLVSGVDLFNLHFFSDPLQCFDVPCEVDHIKKIHGDLIEFVPQEIAFVAADETVFVEIKKTIPIGQAACTYSGKIHAIADVEGLCLPKVSEEIDLTLEVLPLVDVDIDDNHGNVSDNVLHLTGAKGDLVTGTFTVVNPNSEVKNVDMFDGPGNIRIDPVPGFFTIFDLVKIGDPAVVIPSEAFSSTPLQSLGSGEAQKVTISFFIPDGIPVNAFYEGTVSLLYESCEGGEFASDSFSLQLEVLPTQGTLDILQTDLSDTFCPDNPWTMVGQVAFSFDVHANGDHRNIRVSSGGLKHDSLDKKLDDFNFFPEEIAFLAAGETRTINVITKIPIGQHSGDYADYFRVVSENAGEDSVHAEIEICPIFDMDIKDNYANLIGGVMKIQAIGRANASGGEWKLRAFDLGLPAALVENHDEYDGPGNTPVDCISCEFAEWSPLWHEDDHDHHFHTLFFFEGDGKVLGEECDWGSGEFKRMWVSIFVPPIKGGENHPGTYKGRLDCYALAGADTVASDYFDLELQLARIVGPPLNSIDDAVFAGYPTYGGSSVYWGDFTGVGLTGSVNLYRRGPGDDDYVRLNATPLAQGSEYQDTDVVPGETYSYRLGIETAGEEIFIGPVSIGGTPLAFHLSQNAPNPFKSQTTIAYELAEPGRVSLKVFDISGRLVRILEDRDQPPGFYSVAWDGRGDSGRRSSNGIYFYRLEGPGFVATKKMMIIR